MVPTSFGVSFCKAEMLFKHIAYTEAKEEKIQRDKLESESGKIWISMDIRKRRVRHHLYYVYNEIIKETISRIYVIFQVDDK